MDFRWSDHAALRLAERGLERFDVEELIRDGHERRQPNAAGNADWRLLGTRADGRRSAVVYDHPALGDPELVRIVSVWTLRDPVRP